jgi:hypothetical protein
MDCNATLEWLKTAIEDGDEDRAAELRKVLRDHVDYHSGACQPRDPNWMKY